MKKTEIGEALTANLHKKDSSVRTKIYEDGELVTVTIDDPQKSQRYVQIEIYGAKKIFINLWRKTRDKSATHLTMGYDGPYCPENKTFSTNTILSEKVHEAVIAWIKKGHIDFENLFKIKIG